MHITHLHPFYIIGVHIKRFEQSNCLLCHSSSINLCPTYSYENIKYLNIENQNIPPIRKYILYTRIRHNNKYMPQIHQKLKIHQKYKTMTKYRISFSPHCLYIKCKKWILGLKGYNLSLKRDIGMIS